MSVESDATSQDLELLETYLDGELEPVQAAALTQRLTAEAALAEMLTELRSQRELRMAVWKALEPDARTTEQLIWRVRGAAAERRHEDHEDVAERRRMRGSHWDVWKVTRWTTAAAACAIIGFSLGRVGRVGHTRPVSPAGISDQMDVADRTSTMPGPRYILPGQPAPANVFPFQNPSQAGRYDDDFAHDVNLTGSPAPVSGDDRVKLTSDDKDVQKF